MDFRPLEKSERDKLIGALQNSVDTGHAILMDRRDTSFAGESADVDEDAEVVNAIRAVPVHY